MAFMQQQIQFGLWLEVETRDGTDFIPADLVDTTGMAEGHTYGVHGPIGRDVAAAAAQYVGVTSRPERIETVRLFKGYGARLSAPGYMDCTDWCVFDSHEAAVEYLEETYGDETEDSDAD